MNKLTKYGIAIGLAMAIFSLAYTVPAYAESCNVVDEVCVPENEEGISTDSIDAVDDGEGGVGIKNDTKINVDDDDLVVGDAEDDVEDLEDSEDLKTVDMEARSVVKMGTLSSEDTVKKISITPVYLVKFVEVGESITVTDELADNFDISAGMGMGLGLSLVKGSGAEPVTITRGDGGVFTITVNTVGSYNVSLLFGEELSTSIMINAVEFTDTDDPTLSELIDNFKVAMKAIEEAINSGDYSVMEAAWQSYSDAMKADAEKFYGWDDYDKMTALMRVMSMLITGEDLVVEQYVYQYQDEDFEWIYENDSEYATVLDELMKMLAEAGYTDNISVYDFDLAVYNNGEEVEEDGMGEPIAWLNNLSSERVIVIEAESPEEGYDRQYVVARAHFEGYEQDSDGNYIYDDNGYYIPIYTYKMLDNVSFDSETGLLSVWSDKFSVFAISYNDVLIPKAPDTGKFTNMSSIVGDSASFEILMMITGIMMVGVVKFAKRK